MVPMHAMPSPSSNSNLTFSLQLSEQMKFLRKQIEAKAIDKASFHSIFLLRLFTPCLPCSEPLFLAEQCSCYHQKKTVNGLTISLQPSLLLSGSGTGIVKEKVVTTKKGKMNQVPRGKNNSFHIFYCITPNPKIDNSKEAFVLRFILTQ